MTQTPINLFDFEKLARDRLDKTKYDHIAGAAGDEITIKRTRAVFDSIMLRPRMLVDVSERDMSTSVLGQRIEIPVMLAPAGQHGRAHPDGELASARAAGSMGTAMLLSAGSSYTLEEVGKVATGPIWFQQYLYKDRALTKSFTERAGAAGCSAICITVDSRQPARRERDVRNAYVTPPSPTYGTAEPERRVHELGERPGGAPSLVDQASTWSDLEWLVSDIPLPVVVKGIMTAEDARLCVQHGAKAVVVSNHGGRQLDTTFATIEVLPEIVEAVDGRLEVYLDGGIMRGTDVFKALALGARAVFIGRPVFWGLAVNGEAGLREVLQILRDELDVAMALSGCPTLETIDRTRVATVSPLMSVLSPSIVP